jgi:hypothetical protein
VVVVIDRVSGFRCLVVASLIKPGSLDVVAIGAWLMVG